MNDDGALYSNHNELAKFDAGYILDKHLKLLKWQGDEQVLDVGAADGSVSLEVLLPRLPKGLKKLTVSDIQENLLKFGKSKYTDPRVEFLQLDIQTSALPKQLYQNFDHIFSFYCLQWVTDEAKQIQAWKNIYDMLKPGGGILFTIVQNFSTYDYCENLAKTKKWAPYLKNINEFIGAYNYLEKPVEKLKYFLETTGFDIHVCESETLCYPYSSFSNYLNFALSINPFIKQLPENERENFIADFEKEIRKHEMIRIEADEDGKEKVHQSYNILVGCASKPSENVK